MNIVKYYLGYATTICQRLGYSCVYITALIITETGKETFTTITFIKAIQTCEIRRIFGDFYWPIPGIFLVVHSKW